MPGVEHHQQTRQGDNSLRYEDRRLLTFNLWPPNAPISKEPLARAGFYYNGNGTEVVCFSCGGKISEWQHGEMAIAKHRQLFPNCDFVQQQSDNVPLVKKQLSNGHANGYTSNGQVVNGYINGHRNAGYCESYDIPPQRRVQAIRPNGSDQTYLFNGHNNGQATPSSSRLSAINDGASLSIQINATLEPSTSSEHAPHRENGACGHSEDLIPMEVIERNCSNEGRTQPRTDQYEQSERYLRERMKSEAERLRSFRWTVVWPHNHPSISPEKMARAGFFYLMNNDRVMCPFCTVVILGFEPNDDPFLEHVRHSPRCAFMNQEDVGNIPIGEDPFRGRKFPQPARGHDVVGSINPNANFHRPHFDYESLGLRPHRGPKNPQYVTFDARLRTFHMSHWENDTPVTPSQLAEAGFFYIGVADYVKCYHCDGGLCNWERGDDPWEEHADKFPDCEFVRLTRGNDFVNQVQRKHRITDMQSVSAETVLREDDALALKVVEDWMQSDIVKQLMQSTSNPYQPNLIKSVLHRRWMDEQRPFDTFDDLHDAVVRWREPISGSQESSSSQSSQSSNSVLSDDECYGSQSSASSLSPPSSSPLSSSPEPSLLIPSEQTSSDDDHRTLCKICLDREIGVLFLPCAHLVACTQCAPGVSDCPICRKKIQATVRTFFS